MPQLGERDYVQFNRMLDELASEIDGMKEVPRNFMRDMAEKNKLYGEQCFVSPAQLNWIKRLHEEYVGDTDHAMEDDE